MTVPTHEADKFFMNPNSFEEQYRFEPGMLGAAHRYCQLGVEREMYHHAPLVVVSNTGTRLKEIQPYIDLAELYNYEVEIIRTPGPWDPQVLFERNTHNVPLATIEKQLARYAEHPDETEWSDMTIFNANE